MYVNIEFVLKDAVFEVAKRIECIPSAGPKGGGGGARGTCPPPPQPPKRQKTTTKKLFFHVLLKEKVGVTDRAVTPACK